MFVHVYALYLLACQQASDFLKSSSLLQRLVAKIREVLNYLKNWVLLRYVYCAWC